MASRDRIATFGIGFDSTPEDAMNVAQADASASANTSKSESAPTQ